MLGEGIDMHVEKYPQCIVEYRSVSSIFYVLVLLVVIELLGLFYCLG